MMLKVHIPKTFPYFKPIQYISNIPSKYLDALQDLDFEKYLFITPSESFIVIPFTWKLFQSHWLASHSNLNWDMARAENSFVKWLQFTRISNSVQNWIRKLTFSHSHSKFSMVSSTSSWCLKFSFNDDLSMPVSLLRLFIIIYNMIYI